jgi:hypothetical protein
MTDEQAEMAVPSALAAVLRDEGFETSVSGLLHCKQIGPVYIEVYHVMDEEWDVLCETRRSYSVSAVDLVRAGDTLNRIEQSLAGDAAPGAGEASDAQG